MGKAVHDPRTSLMDLDFDLRLRLAVFDHVDSLQREAGGVIPSARLNEGPNGLSLCRIHHGAYDVLAEYRAGEAQTYPAEQVMKEARDRLGS